MSSKKIVLCAVMTALLIAVQFTLSFVSGVELVSVLLLCFCYTFGVYCGLLTATSFSLIRCLIFGFTPNVMVLYLIYYNLFALFFGILGKHHLPTWICPILLIILAAASAYFALTGIPISILYQTKISIMLWTLFGLLVALLLFYFLLLIKHNDSCNKEIASVTTLAAFCTVLFTLLDDIITPLMLGYSINATIVYFYTGFLAMLPQTLCVAISVFFLFKPLQHLLGKLSNLTQL